MILLVGGTGTLGRLLIPKLVASDLRVRVLTRHPISDMPSSDDVEVVTGDVRDTGALDVAMAGVGTVVSAMSGFGGREPTRDTDGRSRRQRAPDRRGTSLGREPLRAALDPPGRS